MTEAEFFAGHSESQNLYQVLRDRIGRMGPAGRQVSKSQIAFRRRDASPRWKEIVEPRPGHFTHHLELYSADDIDAEVDSWLQKACDAAV